MEKISCVKKSEDSAEAIKALENSIRIMARMMVKAVMKELSTQERIFGEIAGSSTLLSSRASMSEQNEKSLVFSVSEAARLLGVSKNTVYEATRTGQIPSIKWGKRILIPKVALMKMLEEAGSVKTDCSNPIKDTTL